MFAAKVEEHKRQIEFAAEVTFNKMALCRCCDRHQVDRLKSLKCLKDYPQNNKCELCRCDCRHQMRKLQRRIAQMNKN
jgi:hypothetical protein